MKAGNSVTSVYSPRRSMQPVGQPTLKSSVLCSNGGKLVSQLLVHDHLTAHYKKLDKVKPAVDTSAPKAWLARKKGRSACTPRKSSHVIAYRSQSAQPLTDYAIDYGDTIQHRSRYVSEDSYDNTDEQLSITDNHHLHPSASQTLREEMAFYAKTGVERPKYDSNDILEKHNNYFRNEKPFTPRTLQTGSKSALSTMSCYRSKHRQRRSRNDSTTEGLENHDAIATTKSLANPGMNTMLSESLANDTLRSHDGRPNGTPSGVPPLNISLDPDNLHFQKLKQQDSKKSQTKGSSSPVAHKPPGSKSQTKGSSPPTVHKPPGSGAEIRVDASVQFLETLRPVGVSKMETYREQRRSKDDEKYQDFVQEVTSDVLERGIFTNWGLKQAFESHIERKRAHLDELRMRELLDDLQKKLGVPKEDGADANDLGFGSTLRPMKDRLDSPTRAQHVTKLKTDNTSAALSSTHAGTTASGRPPLPRPGARLVREDSVKEPLGTEHVEDSLTDWKYDHGADKHSKDEESDVTSDAGQGFDEIDSGHPLAKTAVMPLSSVPPSRRVDGDVEKSPSRRKLDADMKNSPARNRRIKFHQEKEDDVVLPNSSSLDLQNQNNTELTPGSSLNSLNHQHHEVDRNGSERQEDDSEVTDEDYETNEEFMDTMTLYTKKVEQTVQDDENGGLSSDECREQSTPVPQPRQYLAVNDDAHLHADTSGSFEVSDPDDDPHVS